MVFRRSGKAVLLTAIMLVSFNPYGAAGISSVFAVGDTYVAANFNNYPSTPSTTGPVAEVGGNWGLYNAKAGTDYAVGETVYGRQDRSLKLVSSTPLTSLYTSKFNLNVPGKVVLEASVMAGDVSHTRLFDLKSNSSVWKNFLNMDPAGKLTVLGVNVGSYTANTWYNVRAILDQANKKADVYINNTLHVNGGSLGATWDTVNTIKLTQTGTSVTGAVYLDDVKLSAFVPVSAVAVNPSEVTVGVGNQLSLLAVVTPLDATDQRVAWTSDNPAIVRVDANGTVTGVSEGTANITATSADGGKTATAAVTTISSYIPVSDITIPSTTEIPAGVQIQLNAVISPANATNPQVNWTSVNPAVAVVDANGVVTGMSVGQAVITATTVDGRKTATTTVTVVPPRVESVTVIPFARVAKNDTITLTAVVHPSEAVNKEVTWSTDNPSVAVVDAGGVVTGISVGQAMITAVSIDGNKTASSEIQVTEPKQPADEYDVLRLKRKSVLDGGPNLQASDPDVASKIAKVNDTAQKHWSSLDKSISRTGLWSDSKPTATVSDAIHTNYSRIRDMAYAYSTKGGPLYHNLQLRDDIVQALNWLYTNQYNETGTQFGNWWNFQIGIPAKLTDTLVMIYDDLSQQQIENYIKAIDHFTPDIASEIFDTSSYYSGANRSDILLFKLADAILLKNGERILRVSSEMSLLFPYVKSGDGFYEDGSFVMHGKLAYTGSYGSVMLSGISHLLYLLNGSSWPVEDPNVHNVYHWIYDSIAPIIYNGRTMDMVNGRSIARGSSNAFNNAAGIISAVARLAQNAPAEDQLNYKKMLKYWIAADQGNNNIYGSSLNIDLIAYVKQFMNDSSVAAEGDLPDHFEFAGMARSVHKGSGYAFGVSKSSKRIQTYELTNGENGEGWYTGDGMTYLYNRDLNQYADDYWATVNRYRLPGTTVDTRPRVFNNYQNGDGEGTPINSWAGGTDLGLYGSSGMQLRQIGTTLTANKSWFMFGDEIVALGSGITSTDNRTIESIVEQRKLDSTGDNALIVNGMEKPASLGWSETMDNVHWAHLAGSAAGSDIGYYFPDSPSLKGVREQRTGRWSDINSSIPVSDPVSKNYLSLWFDHGANPSGGSYSYVLLPNKSAEEVSRYADHPAIKIIENSNQAHAVKHKQLNITAIQFWQDVLKKTDIITSNKKASVMIRETDQHELELAVSDPTLENAGAIELEIDRSAVGIIASDPQIIVTQLAPTIKITVNVNQSAGQTFKAKFDLDAAKPRPHAKPHHPR